MILVISGPPGAGKSTVARLIADRLANSVLLDGDSFFHAVQAGYVEPWLAEANDQNAVVISAIGAAAIAYAAGGYDVVVDGVIGPWFLDRIVAPAAAKGIDVHYVVLRPSPASSEERALARSPGELIRPEPVRHMISAFADLGSAERNVLDSSALSPEETAKPVVAGLEAGDWRVPAAAVPIESAIRSFGLQDYDAVIDLWTEAGLGMGPSETRHGIALRLERDPDLFFVALDDGAIVGAVMGAFDGRRGWVYHLAVREDRQRRGIGQALLAELERRLRAKGCVKLNLLVEPANASVVAFYERLGYRSDELVFMEKWLTVAGGPVAAASPSRFRPGIERGWRELSAIDARLDAGDIDEAGWHHAVADVVRPAYLSANSPWGGSGYIGTAAEWEYARSLIADAIDRDGSFLDVGCANGYLLETLPAWTPHTLGRSGVDIVPELVELARMRLPDLAGRLFVGNALTWTPPERYTYIRTGLDYVPAARRPELVAHLLRFCERLIVGVFSEESEVRVTESLMASWGNEVTGRSERRHRRNPALDYRVVWIDSRR